MNRDQVLGRLPGYQGRYVLVKKFQGADDIIQLLLKQHQEHAKDFDRVAADFWAGSPEATAEKLFDFMKKNVRYKEEPEHKQTVMSPAAMLTRRRGDCKHYASFIVGVLDSLRRQGYKGFDPVYRFSSYRLMDKTPQHVFAVMKTPEREIWIDPVLKRFDQKKRYYYSTDRQPMALYKLAGFDEFTSIGAPKAKKVARQQKRVQKLVKRGKTEKAAKVEKKQAFRNAAADARKADRKAPGGPKGLKKILLKTGGAASRNAFLLLLKANVFRMATKIHEKVKKDPSFKGRIEKFWRNAGGNTGALWANVQRGVNTFNKLHKKKKISGFGNHEIAQAAFGGVWEHPEYGAVAIGAAPAAVGIAAAIAAAMPIIAKLISMFKKEGIDTAGMTEGADAAAEQTEQLAQDQAAGNMATTEAAQQSMEEFNIPQAAAPVNVAQQNDGSTDLTFPTQTELTAGNTGLQQVRTDDAVTRTQDAVQTGAQNAANAVTDTMTQIKNFLLPEGQPWYKKPAIIVPVGVVALIAGSKILTAATSGTKRRRR